MTYYYNVASGLIGQRKRFISGVPNGQERLLMIRTCFHWQVSWLVGFIGCFERGLLPVLY